MLSGCAEEIDFERPEYERGTLGEELWGIWHKDSARSAHQAEQKRELLERKKDKFVEAVDTAAPPDKLQEVDSFLGDMMELVDSGLMPGLTRKVDILLREAADNEALVAGLQTETRPDAADFLSPVNNQNFIGHMMGYSRIPEVATRTADTLLAADGRDEEGNVDGNESRALADLLNAISFALSEAEVGEPTDTIAYALQDALAAEDERYLSAEDNQPLHAVMYDYRGLPLVASDSTGVLPPFVDQDGDGLADVDERGHWILAGGESREIPAFALPDSEQSDGLLNRDVFGRGSAGGSQKFSFEYIDLKKTGVHFLVRKLHELAEQKILWNLVDAAPALLGPREIKADSRGTFSGYSSDNPLNDVAYAALHILDIAHLDRVLEKIADFIASETASLAGLLHALDEAVEVMDDYPEAGLEDNQTLAHDLLPILESLSADPQLWSDVFWAFRQPVSKHTGAPMATLLKYKDPNPAVPEKDGPYDSCFNSCKQRFKVFEEHQESSPLSCQERYQPLEAVQRYECIRACPNDEMFSALMDFDAPESESNRSMFQRLFHLLRDTAGTPFELRMTKPENLRAMPAIAELPGSAEAFLRSVGSELDMADYVPDMAELQPLLDLLGGANSLASLLSQLSPVFGVELSRRVTPDEITRMFNKEEFVADIGTMGEASIAPPVCKDGYIMATHHADMLYTAEASGMIDTISPLACAFSMHDQTELMTELFVVAHAHYSGHDDLYQTADQTTSPMKGSNLRSFEPALFKILEDGAIFDALYELALAADRVETSGGGDVIEELRLLVYHATRSDDGFTKKDGESTLTLADGRTLRELSRLHILLDGLEQMDARVQENPEAKKALADMFSSLADVLLAVERPEGTVAEFKDPGSVAMLEHLIRHLSKKAGELAQDGRLSDWLTQEQMSQVEELWDSRTLPALIDLSEALSGTQEDRDLVDDMMQYLLGDRLGQDQATMALYTALVSSLQQDTTVPLAHFLADAIDPERTWQAEPYGQLPLVSHLLRVLRDTTEKDPEGRGLDLFARGFTKQEDVDAPFMTIFGLVLDYFRPDPASQTPYTSEDYQAVFRALADWMSDDVHGLEQLYNITQLKAR